jgi:transcription initiation factor TFIID subunit 2
VIERGTERDLGTISQNLANDVYASLEEVEADLNLMVENCFTFNPPENAVYGSGLEVQKMLKVGIAKIRAEAAGKKRSGDQAAGASHKKQKM